MRDGNVSQSIFEAYKHPFVLTYLGASLLVIYLPVSYLKDYICDHYQRKNKLKPKNSNAHGIRLSSLPGSPMRSNGVHKNSEIDLEKMVLMKEINSEKQDPQSIHPFLTKASSSLDEFKDEIVFTTWEIAKISMIMAPLWVITEV